MQWKHTHFAVYLYKWGSYCSLRGQRISIVKSEDYQFLGMRMCSLGIHDNNEDLFEYIDIEKRCEETKHYL